MRQRVTATAAVVAVATAAAAAAVAAAAAKEKQKSIGDSKKSGCVGVLLSAVLLAAVAFGVLLRG